MKGVIPAGDLATRLHLLTKISNQHALQANVIVARTEGADI